MKRKLIFLVLFLLVGGSLIGQNDTIPKERILCHDGNQYIGVVKDSIGDTLIVETQNLGIIKIPTSTIKSRQLLIPVVGEKGELKYWPKNHHASRYFFGPTGYGLKKGEGYYQNNWIFFNQVSYGFTDNFTMGVGVIPLIFFGESFLPVWITPKVSFEIKPDKFYMGAGALAGTVLGEKETGFGVAYGTATMGSKDKNLTMGLGYGFGSGGWADSPTISVSAMVRGSEKFYFMTENYWFGIGDFGLISFGGRTAWPNLALDYGGVIPIGLDEAFIMPWLGISVPFGR